MDPQPINRQCLSTLRERAIFSFSWVHTGLVKANFARSPFTAVTRPPVEVDPILTMSISCFCNFCTLACFASPSVLTPSSLLSKKKLISTSLKISGSVFTAPRTCPIKRSARVRTGSTERPTPTSPPGTAYCNSLLSAFMERMTDMIGEQTVDPDSSLYTIPGRTSILSPTRRTPWTMDPPATPPLRSSTSSPGLFTSKDRITIMRGDETKSRTGTGTFLIRYSTTMSMLYLSCAEMGITGAPCATVPRMNSMIS
mmetsp:Transcript_18228/g.38053  ORF Transcript_18228/g.38053 Transcript_18228/m.38053 type:complete len:255 (+) Transcript_18228:1851-2615(+)